MGARIPKFSTGLESLDHLTEGGLPAGRATLVVGAPGAGKTVVALQIAVAAARRGVPGIFVTLEEGEDEIRANAASFTWDPSDITGRNLMFYDGRASIEAMVTGDFDLDGLIAGLGALGESGSAQCVVLDGLDQLLGNLPDLPRRRAEMYRLLQTLSRSNMTTIITAKGDDDGNIVSSGEAFMQFAAQCVVALRRRTTTGAMVRTLQVLKYRGSSFGGSEVPYIIDEDGVVPALVGRSNLEHHLSRERVPTGVADLDAILEGGYIRGSAAVISGAPGTAKTTLGASFARAAAARGERALYVAFDESYGQVVLDMQSLGLHLDAAEVAPNITGLSLSALGVTAEEHYIAIRRTLERAQPDVVVIDPVSALFKGYESARARGVAERLVDMVKSRGITTVLTSLVEPDSDFSASSISTLADAWLSLNYVVVGNRRGRALSVIKARGTQHAHEVFNLGLSRAGMRLSPMAEGSPESGLGHG